MLKKNKIKIDIFKKKIWKRTNLLSLTEMRHLILLVFNEVIKQQKMLISKDNYTKILNVTKTIIENNKTIILNVNFVDKIEMTNYNYSYRNQNKETNVLSFENANLPIEVKNDIVYIGEMVLCYEKIKQEAIEYNKSFDERLKHLFIHSFLHLLGFNHIEEDERITMETLEEQVLMHVNISNPYEITNKL